MTNTFRFSHILPTYHCVKSVKVIEGYSGPYFLAFGMNTEIYEISLRIQSECGKIPTRITPNTDTFHAVYIMSLQVSGRPAKYQKG